MKNSMPGLRYELIAGEAGDGLIAIEQQDGGGSGRVLIHPIHLRHMAEQLGLSAANDQQQLRTIQTLQRRLVAITGRVTDLAAWMAQHSDHEHADLSHEMTTLNAICDLANEWCADFSGNGANTSSGPTEAPQQAALL